MAIESWWNFFYLCGSASATLTGLMFIAVTLGVTLIKKETLDRVEAFVSPIFYHFMHVFFLCCAFAVPGSNAKLLAAAAFLSGLWRLARIRKAFLVVHERSQHPEDEIDYWDWLGIIFFPIIIYLVLITAGIGLWLGTPWAIYALAASCLSLLLCAARQAWETLVWIAAMLT